MLVLKEMNMDTEKVCIGNVNFDKDSILCSKQVYENGRRLNYVFLVGGTKITFPDQENKNAAVSLAMNYSSDVAEICAWFNNIKGLIIEESPRKGNYYIRET